MIAIPKHNEEMNLSFWDGIKITIELRTDQKWKVRKSRQYNYLTKKNSCICIRMTEKAFNECFYKEREENA